MLSISSFKTGNFRDIFTWDKDEGYRFWPIWARQSGTMIQLITLLLVPATGVVQSIRYLSTGPADLFEVRGKLQHDTFVTGLHLFIILHFIVFAARQVAVPTSIPHLHHPAERARVAPQPKKSEPAAKVGPIPVQIPVTWTHSIRRSATKIHSASDLQYCHRRQVNNLHLNGRIVPFNLLIIRFETQNRQVVTREHPAKHPADPRHGHAGSVAG